MTLALKMGWVLNRWKMAEVKKNDMEQEKDKKEKK